MINNEIINLKDSFENTEHQKEQIKKEIHHFIIPFYERFYSYLKIPSYLFGLVVVLFFFLLHFGIATAYNHSVFKDFSFMVSLMIGFCLHLVLLATSDLKTFVINLIELSGNELDEYREKFVFILNDISNYKLLKYGLFFGVFNASLGIFFGHWYKEIPLILSLVIQHFVIGLVCGLAVGGIVIVFKLIAKVSKEHLNLEFFNPDHCAGTLIIGKLLFRFSMYTLLMGIVIALYIHSSPWLYKGIDPIVDFMIMLWMFFPFIAAILVFIFPVLKIHRVLLDYKFQEHEKVRYKLKELSNEIIHYKETGENDFFKYSLFKNKFDHYKMIDDYIAKINVWPYDVKYSLSFVISLILPIVIAILSKLVSKNV